MHVTLTQVTPKWLSSGGISEESRLNLRSSLDWADSCVCINACSLGVGGEMSIAFYQKKGQEKLKEGGISKRPSATVLNFIRFNKARYYTDMQLGQD